MSSRQDCSPGSQNIARETKEPLHRQIANGMGMALRHLVVVLSCAAISLAATMGGPGGSGGGGSAAVNNDYAPGKAGNDVRGDA